MPVESPEQFELITLESFIKALDQPNSMKAGKWCAIFGAIGAALLIAVYFLHGVEWISSYWVYSLCVLSGFCLGGAAIINRLRNQSRLLVRYIDREAINKRIAELKV